MPEDKKLPDFDADLSPNSQNNKQAAAVRGLRYDPKSRHYKDADGCLIRDRYGQRL